MKQTYNNKGNAKNNAPQKQKSARLSVSTPMEYQTADGETKTHWTTVGSAFETEKGYSVILTALPVNGRLFINSTPYIPETDKQ